MSGVFDTFAERILTVDRPVAEAWGEMLARSGKHVDDTGLAATARVHRLVDWQPTPDGDGHHVYAI
jgi:predicted nucleic acid-binding protein